jgi:putative flippase GtrA
LRKILNFQFVRFLLVGTLNTGFSYAVYAALLYLGLGYVQANLAAALLGILFSFRTQGRLVFGNNDGRLIFRFAALWGGIFLLNILLISLLIRAGLNAYWAGALAMAPITLLSYLVQKFLVFGASQPAGAAKPNW